MATLIAVYNSEGCVGRCDARCYNAESETCHCICGGMNHGAGIAKAMTNTSELFEKWIDDYREDHEFDRVEVPVVTRQQALPGFYMPEVLK